MSKEQTTKDKITKEKLKKYFSVTEKALAMAKKSISKKKIKEAHAILDMASRYYKDALWFQEKEDLVNAFACLNYSHGWLDCGSKLGIFRVKDSKLFILK
jgi:hypothetical protein